MYAMTQERWRLHVNTSTFYSSNVIVITLLGGDMHSHERLLVLLCACFLRLSVQLNALRTRYTRCSFMRSIVCNF